MLIGNNKFLRFNLAAFGVIVMLFVACDTDESVISGFEGNGERPIVLVSGISQSRSANTNLQSVQINEGVKVGAFVTSGNETIADNVELTADGKGGLDGDVGYYPKTGTVSVYAYAPFAEAWTLDGDNKFNVAEDQSTDKGYLDSDLLCGTPSGDNSFASQDDAIALKFEHMLSKITVKVDNSSSDVRIAGATVSLVGVKTGACLNVMSGKIGEASGEPSFVKIMTVDGVTTDISGSAVVVPQCIGAGQFVRIATADGRVLIASLASAVNFESKKAYTYTVKITGSGGSATAVIDANSSVTDWEDNVVLPQTSLLPLHVEGRQLVDENGNPVLLHGFAQTYSSWFNEQGTKWTNYDVGGCLKYNQNKIDELLEIGWNFNWLRLHMDPYWSNIPDKETTGREDDISAFSMYRFRVYFEQVFLPMAEYAISKGLYVVMRPPGICPNVIAVGDDYQQYLLDVWSYVASLPRVKNNPHIMFELANEPVNIVGTDGNSAGKGNPQFEALQQYFQKIVDVIREQGADNVIWVPGLGYQTHYEGYAVYPIKGENIGYAVHCYPGWYGSDGENEDGGISGGGGYDSFKEGWTEQVAPVAEFAPVIVTEMDWAPAKYDSSWGKGFTGEAGGSGFGANFKKIVDEMGNVSWLIFTNQALLAQYDDDAPDGDTFLTDPEACVRPVYRWFKEYAGE